jgi:hypothetical protein
MAFFKMAITMKNDVSGKQLYHDVQQEMNSWTTDVRAPSTLARSTASSARVAKS